MSVFDDLAEKTIISKFNGFASHGALFVNLGYLARYSSPLTVVLTNADGIPKSYTYDSVSKRMGINQRPHNLDARAAV